MTKKTKISMIILTPIVVIVALVVGIGTHFYNFPTWTREVEDLAMEYLTSQEEIYEKYGEDVCFSLNGIQYNTETRDSVVKIKVNTDLYHVTVDCIKDEFVVRSYEKVEN